MQNLAGNIYFIAVIAVIGGALFGFDISSMSAIISTQPYLCQFNQRGFDENGRCLGPTDAVQGGITAAMPGGSWLGALVSGFLSDSYGRKRSIQIGSVIWVIGSILVCTSVNIPMLVLGRIINGFSVGICSAQVPVYISEISPPSKRGRLVGFQQWAITWGILIMYFICYGSAYMKTSAAFRVPWGIQMIPAILLFLGLCILPESPRWLAKHDRWDETTEVLTMIHGKGDPNSPFVHHELLEIREVVEFERANADVSFRELFAPKMINRTIIGVFTQIWSQLTGMNVMMYYITYVFTMAGLAGDSDTAVLLPSGINFVINVIMTVPALLWMDRWGRRPTLLVGAFLMCLWLCVNAGIFAIYSRPPLPGEFTSTAESMAVSGAPAKAIIASTYLFVASFAPTWGPVSWTYPPELYPLRLRGKAVALCTSANWAFNFALAYFVPPAFAQITWKTYVLFATFCAAMFLHVFFMFPETANKPLEEVEKIFDDTQAGAIKYIGVPAWKTKNDRTLIIKQENNEALPKEG
ncbi:putative high-affinity glucose transporter protein [Thermochaetoides thermophila DSM 1495]|uniref:Putative high-affinity glucose transporter protein n=1 Tax=Chaetomium thermophilum (strain DSM 1495 / CBS 144.50 / IMI 039719) TaxID=759272 RepID=G0S3H0_CHATD|nr:putative high-affinity glucose transporter protein [Thermochaetoides thermophila DSM 1495]EGS22553.1 putative high-affinity glucose transporter protein [Thermochaetoides thermophila DSM 1495]